MGETGEKVSILNVDAVSYRDASLVVPYKDAFFEEPNVGSNDGVGCFGASSSEWLFKKSLNETGPVDVSVNCFDKLAFLASHVHAGRSAFHPNMGCILSGSLFLGS